VCLIFRQNGGDSLLREEEDPIPQLFHIPMWIRQKKLFRTRVLRQRFSGYPKAKEFWEVFPLPNGMNLSNKLLMERGISVKEEFWKIQSLMPSSADCFSSATF
jgi:hypothetical protein